MVAEQRFLTPEELLQICLNLSMAVTEAAALYNAIAMLTQQVQLMAEQGSQRGGGDRFKNLKIFSGDAKDFEESLYRGAVGEGVVP